MESCVVVKNCVVGEKRGIIIVTRCGVVWVLPKIERRRDPNRYLRATTVASRRKRAMGWEAAQSDRRLIRAVRRCASMI